MARPYGCSAKGLLFERRQQMTNTHTKTNLQLGMDEATKAPKPATGKTEKTAPSMQYQQGFAAGR